MRPMPNSYLEMARAVQFELQHYGMSGRGTGNGVFIVQRKSITIRIISSADTDWEHVSVSLKNRCPNWDEMCFVKNLFWLPTESVMQLHPPEEEYVNNHLYCLHLWRPVNATIPLPPSIYVGVKDAGVLKDSAHARAVRQQVVDGR